MAEQVDRPTVLLVDDEEIVRVVTSHALDRLGYEVVEARSGREALDLLAEHGERIACVLLDLSMPEMSGEECFKEMRRLREDVCVLLSSGYNEQSLASRFEGWGLAGFIQKPYTLDVLQGKLEAVIV